MMIAEPEFRKPARQLVRCTEAELAELEAGGQYPWVEVTDPRDGTKRQRMVDSSGWLFRNRRTLGPRSYCPPPFPEQIRAALLSLAALDPVRTKGAFVCSYNLKHTLERFAGDYISNGAAIVAAYQLGIELQDFKPYPELNANLCLSKKWYKQAGKFAYDCFRFCPRYGANATL